MYQTLHVHEKYRKDNAEILEMRERIVNVITGFCRCKNGFVLSMRLGTEASVDSFGFTYHKALVPLCVPIMLAMKSEADCFFSLQALIRLISDLLPAIPDSRY